MSVDLSQYHPGGQSEALPKVQEVSRFKEPQPGRVLAHPGSIRHIAYTLKDATKIRIVALAGHGGGPAASLSLDDHSAPIKAISFMNPKSNVVASFSDKELLVWLIPADGSAAPAVSLKFTDAPVTAIAWSHEAADNTQFSDLYATTAAGELLSIPVAKLHHKNMQDESGTVRVAPVAQVAVKKNQCKVLSNGLSKNNNDFRAAVVEAGNAVVATASANTLLVVRPGGAVVKFGPVPEESKDEAIVDVCVLGTPRPNTVAVATARTLTFWDIALDAPHKLLQVSVPLNVLKATATHARLVLAVAPPTAAAADAPVTRLQLAAIALGFRNKQNAMDVRGMTLRDVELDVPFNAALCSVASNSTGGDDPVVTMDNGKSIAIYTLPAFYTKSAAAHQQQQPAGIAPGGYAAAAGGAAPAAAAAMPPAPRSANAAMQQMGSASSGGDAEFNGQLSAFGGRLTAKAEGVRSKADDLLHVLPDDHRQLIAQSLNDQRGAIATAIQEAVNREFSNFSGGNGSSSSSSSGGSFSLDEEKSAQISEVVIRGVTDSIVESVARGISTALNKSLADRVDKLVNTAINRYTKRVKKAQTAEGNKSAESVAVEILAAAQKELESKQKDAGMQLLLQLQQLNKPATETLQRMQRVVERQQKFIDSFTQSGILEELQRMRDEVATLRAGGAGAHGAASSGPSKATILARAVAALKSGNVDQALAWVLQQNDCEMTLSLMNAVDEDTLLDVLDEDETVAADKWVRVATDMTQILDAAQLPVTLRVLDNIVGSERVGLTKNPRAKQVLMAYVNGWKEQAEAELAADVRSKLRDVMIALK